MKLRPSTYNVILSVKREDEEVFFVWNSLRESAAIINDELLSVLKKPSLAKDKEDLEFLIDHGFLVEKEMMRGEFATLNGTFTDSRLGS